MTAKLNKYLLFILLFAFGLRIYKLASIPVYLDEYLTITSFVPLPALDIFRNFYSNNHPLASLLAHLYSPQADNYFLMRWPIVWLGVLTLPVLYRLGAFFVNRKVALIGVFLITVSPYHLAFSTSVRGYAGLILGTTASLYLLGKALTKGTWYYWLALGAVNLVTLYFHLFSVLATIAQFVIAIGWCLWQPGRKSTNFKAAMKPAVTMLLFLLISSLLLSAQTRSVLLENGGEGYANNDFRVWYDGLNSVEDTDPLAILPSLLGPMAPFGFETYVYVLLASVGLMALFFRHPWRGIATIIWFIFPFIAIFVGTQLLGNRFYAYVRFLAYLLPAYLLLVALGFITLLDKTRIKKSVQLWQVTTYTIKLSIVVGMVTLSIMSLYWFTIRATYADWNLVTKVLVQNLSPQDIVVCQKYENGFQGPESKTGQPYCMWMLDVPLPALTAYTPRFEDTIDAVANYEFFNKNRSILSRPGGVWLVLWQKLSYSPHGQLTTADLPELASLPALTAFNPYEVYRFGSITLVHINTEAALLDNIEQTLKLLLRIEPQPADQARYYRSLTELEAIRGNKSRAKQFFNQSWDKAKQTAQYPDLFLLETEPVVSRLPQPFVISSQTIKIGYQASSAVCLHSFEVSNTTVSSSQILTLTLNWQTVDFVNEDYSYFLQFDDALGKNLGNLVFQPFDRIYPTTWWWQKQRLAEPRPITIPPDLPKQDYVVKLGIHDNQKPFKPLENDSKSLFRLVYQSEKTSWHVEPILDDKAECF